MPQEAENPPVPRSPLDVWALSPDEACAILARALGLELPASTDREYDRRYVLVRPEVFVNLQKQLEQTVGASTKGILYLAGERTGKEGTREIGPLLEGPAPPAGPAETARRFTDVAALLGMGRFSIVSVDMEHAQATLTLESSAIARLYGPARKPVCHLLAGWIAGIGSLIFRQDLLCEEVSCRAQGKPLCEFRVRPMPFA